MSSSFEPAAEPGRNDFDVIRENPLSFTSLRALDRIEAERDTNIALLVKHEIPHMHIDECVGWCRCWLHPKEGTNDE